MSATYFFYWFVNHASSSNMIMFIVTCWVIWCSTTVNRLSGNVLKKFISYITLFLHVLGTPTIQKPMCEITWISPLEDTIKVNVDISSFNNPRKLGFGGILRNNNSDWLLGFSDFIKIYTFYVSNFMQF